MINSVNSSLFCQMVVSGGNNLENNKQLVNALNVFPVPDGDTGTNMSLTFFSAAAEVSKKEFEKISDAADLIASTTLRSARGNSGVILSQIFRGFAKGLSGKEAATIKDFAAALKSASDTAYRAVMKPTEGTILTIIRTMAAAANEYNKDEDFTAFFEHIINAGNDALNKTPDLLPLLKQAGVVDAGGKGLLIIFEGMLHLLKYGEIIELSDKTVLDVFIPSQAEVPAEDIKYGYCTEFIINKKNYGVSTEKFKAAISEKGDSMLVIDELDIIKVHIHTNNPGFVIEKALEIGELVNIKIDNMRMQHRNIIGQEAHKEEVSAKVSDTQKEYGIISVVAGEGVSNVFSELGTDIVLSGGQTMNPSTEDILKCITNLNAKEIFILPNNKNIVLAANQAKELSEKSVTVIPSHTIPQGLSALLAFDPTASKEENEVAMNNAMIKVKSGSITYAVRDTNVDGFEIKEGDYLGLTDGKITHTSKDKIQLFKDLLSSIYNDGCEVITVFYGEDVSEEEVQSIKEYIEENYPDCDLLFYNGGQPVYSYILSVE